MYKNDTVPHRRTPSFSSSLLDAICRSLDDESAAGDDVQIKIKRHSAHSQPVSAKDFFADINAAAATDSASPSSVSTSRGGSCGGAFSSSSDAESKSVSQRNRYKLDRSRAKKIHGESKKSRQPISPGARIASFLNSIFTSGNGSKVKICSIGGTDDETAERKPKTPCSSCFSKTPPPRANNGGNRSVRFYPASVVVDDDPGLMPIRKIDKKDDLFSRDPYIRRYSTKKIAEFDLQSYVDDEDEDSEEEDDLFELDNLIGDGRLGEELPVFGTTDFKANQAIANGFVV